MKYCEISGEKLILKENGIDGKIPFCQKYHQFKSTTFNSAISATVFNINKSKILIIEQYGKKIIFWLQDILTKEKM